MNKNIILGGLLASFMAANSQNTYPWPNSGNIGINHGTTSSPSFYKLDIFTSTNNDGIRIVEKSTGLGACGVYLDNQTTGGRNWSLLSLGNGDTPGAGYFTIFQNTSASTGYRRFLIDGATGNVGVGVDAPSARLHAVGNATIVGLRGDANGTGVAGNGIGSANTGFMIGVAGRAYDGATNVAGWFQARGGAAGVTTYGVFAEVVYPTLGGTNYGIYATVGGNGNSGSGPNWAGYFNGDVFTTSAGYYSSDRRLKKDIQTLSGSLGVIAKLNPVNYSFDVEANKDLSLPVGKQYGFISQEVEEIMPELTKLAVNPAKFDEKTGEEIYPSKEILGLNYHGFIAILTKGIQEQQVQITDQTTTISDLKSQITKLQNQVNTLVNSKADGATGINQLNGNSTDGFALDQNIPNPFSHETVVKYSLPQQVSTASLVVYDLTGKQIAAFVLTERGASAITLSSEKLAAGMYIYSIVADGKIVDSKRMVVAEK